MDDDSDIARQVIEFLLRLPLEDRTLNSVLRALPLPNNKPNAKKTLLLKVLESEVSRHLVSESTLVLLEEVKSLQGNEMASDAMKKAYCAVAVESTVKILKDGGEGDKSKKLDFFEAVKRVWRGRIGRMKECVKKGGLGSEQLWAWKDEIEAAVWDDGISKSLVKKSEVVNVVAAVKAYIGEERERMGLPSLELDGTDQADGKEAPASSGGDAAAADGSSASKEMQKEKIKLKDKLVGVRSSSELHADVKVPLPDWLKLAEEFSSKATNHVKSNLFLVDDGIAHASSVNTSNVRKRSLLEQGGSVRTCEQEASVEASQEDPTPESVVQSLSPRRINTPPFDRYEMKNVKKRRRGRKWSLHEEDTLRDGVKKYGKGCWKVILNINREVFEGRTEVDLKDKWRNMTRY